MPRQPGAASAQTIMIPLAVPVPRPAESARPAASADSEWQQDKQRWRDHEIRRLERLLSEESRGAGGSGGGGGDGGGSGGSDLVGPLVQLIAEASDKGAVLRRLMEEVLRNGALAEALAEVEGATRFGSLLEYSRHRKGAKALKAIVNDPTTTREELVEALRREEWVFGGRYIPQSGLERVPALERVDLAMIRSDGAIHLVGVGLACVPDLVVAAPGGEGYRVGPAVLDLVNKAVDELLTVETQARHVLDGLGVETRRAFATVVIGHPAFAAESAKDSVRTTIRTYSSHLAGLEIVTYKELLDSVDRVLDLIEAADLDPAV